MLHVERASNGNHDRVFFNQVSCGLGFFGFVALGFFLFCNSCLYLVLCVMLQCMLKLNLFQWEGEKRLSSVYFRVCKQSYFQFGIKSFSNREEVSL